MIDGQIDSWEDGRANGGHGEVDIGGIRMEEWNRIGGRMMNEIGWKEGEQDKNQ